MDSGVQFDFLYRTPETGLATGGDKAKNPLVVASPPPSTPPAAAGPAAAAAAK